MNACVCVLLFAIVFIIITINNYSRAKDQSKYEKQKKEQNNHHQSSRVNIMRSMVKWEKNKLNKSTRFQI